MKIQLCKNDHIAMVRCSNPLPVQSEHVIMKLSHYLESVGVYSEYSSYLYDGDAKSCARELMKFYRKDDVKAIFDLSGGDLGNTVLPYLDYDVIAKSNKIFCGYSDLTTVLNAIYTKTGNPGLLYQIRNLCGLYSYKREEKIDIIGEAQRQRFEETFQKGMDSITDFSYRFLTGTILKGTVVGGNIRCFLKLAGTEYWPDMNGKILFIEAYSGREPQIRTFLSQLEQMGVFKQISGLILGTFTEMEQEGIMPTVGDMVLSMVGDKIPIVKTDEVGHDPGAKAIWIGKEIELFAK